MVTARYKTLIIACGALAKEILDLKQHFSLAEAVFDLKCLPAIYHNTPKKIVPGLDVIINEQGGAYDRILIGYGDCGTGGEIDRLIEKYPKAERLPGAHCYAFYTGLSAFDDLMEEELGSFFLTDYLAKHFDTLIIKGMGIDRYPNLKSTYFEHYKRLVYISQSPTEELMMAAENAARFLELTFEHRPVGYGELAAHIAALDPKKTGVASQN